MTKVIITVVGQDSVGIIAKTCNYLAENNINILDITQTITDGYFNMMMIADISGCGNPLGQISDEMTELGMTMGVVIHCQSEEIFTKMHRI